jgi:hypothetical protein
MGSISMAIVLPLLGVFVGAWLQHWLGQKRSRRDQLLQTRAKAYADYLSAVGQKGRYPESAVEERRRILSEIDDAKFRICVYGSDIVVSALAKFEGSPPEIFEKVDIRDRFLELCQAMREDSESGAKTDLATLHLAVHGFTGGTLFLASTEPKPVAGADGGTDESS